METRYVYCYSCNKIAMEILPNQSGQCFSCGEWEDDPLYDPSDCGPSRPECYHDWEHQDETTLLSYEPQMRVVCNKCGFDGGLI